MKRFALSTVFAAAFAVAGCSESSGPSASTGPNGGDLVPIKAGAAYAELLANADTGEVMVHTWDKDLKTRIRLMESRSSSGAATKVSS